MVDARNTYGFAAITNPSPRRKAKRLLMLPYSSARALRVLGTRPLNDPYDVASDTVVRVWLLAHEPKANAESITSR
jgi:hypothetical protein